MPLERPLTARLLVRNTVPVNASSFNHKELLAAARAHNLTFKGVDAKRHDPINHMIEGEGVQAF